MEDVDSEKLVEQLATGFAVLHEEYQKLLGQHQALERKLATAREQYNALVKVCGSQEITTPPLSLSSLPAEKQQPSTTSITLSSTDATVKVRAANSALVALRNAPQKSKHVNLAGVKIWAGPSADKAEQHIPTMPSISESPLEQDFTVEGKPSRLGCPFASMAKQKLSSHAASVLSRYNNHGHGSAAVHSSSNSSVSRGHGHDNQSRRSHARASFNDPIKAEICGLSDHHDTPPSDAPLEKLANQAVDQAPDQVAAEDVENAEAGVCPIRFLDQHSPEEVATYFERHKHELPRSHEECVLRYQSNEQQIRELDSKYGNLVSMIQGLGEKHKEMLPEEPEENAPIPNTMDDAKMRQWASSVSLQMPEDTARDHEDDEERLSHFERPLRDIRLGESPSRPWGIPVPAKYIERAESATSSRAASPIRRGSAPAGNAMKTEDSSSKKCPFQSENLTKHAVDIALMAAATEAQQSRLNQASAPAPVDVAMASTAPAFVESQTSVQPVIGETDSQRQKHRMLFTGPVFFGYSAEDAAQILRLSGLGGASHA